MIVSLRTKAINFEEFEMMSEAGIPEETEKKECLIAVDMDTVDWIIQDPFREDVCYIMLESMPGQTTLMEPYDKVFKLWRASRGEF